MCDMYFLSMCVNVDVGSDMYACVCRYDCKPDTAALCACVFVQGRLDSHTINQEAPALLALLTLSVQYHNK